MNILADFQICISVPLRFVNLQVCRIYRVRGTPAGTKYALCDIMPELLTAACGSKRIKF